jgi:hypothetical protein
MTGKRKPQEPQKMSKGDFIRAVSQLLAGLQVPVSMEMPLGTATVAWTELHRQLYGFGWAAADDYEDAIIEVLEQ